MRFPGVIGVTALVALLLLAGCGGGGKDETTSASGSSAKSAGGGRESGGVAESGGGGARGKQANEGTLGGSASKGSERSSGKAAGTQGGGSTEKQGEASNGSAQSGAGGAPSTVKFTEAADAICVKSGQAIEKALAEQLDETDLKNLAKQAPAIVNKAVVPVLEAEISALRALEAPSGGAQSVAALTGALEEVIGEAQADPQEFVAAPDPFVKSKQAAQEGGFKRCGGS